MRRFRYGWDHILKIAMAAAGGFLILGLAGKYEKDTGRQADYGAEFKRYGNEILKESFGAALGWSYPKISYEAYGEKYRAGTEEGWIGWLRNADPRIRFQMGRTEKEAGYRDPDPSFAGYLEGQQAAESFYLMLWGDEETGTDKADIAGGQEVTAEPGGGGDKESVSQDSEPANSDSLTEGDLAAGSLTERNLAHHGDSRRTVTGTSYVMEQLADYDFLMKHFFSVHSSTTAGRDEMDAARLLGEDLSMEKDPENPQILIYHTHSQETFADYGPDNPGANVVGIGDYLAELLRARGYNVIHDTQVYDLIDGELNRSRAYDLALKGVTAILQENPSVQVILDVHRDGVREDLHMVSEVNGKPTAPIMFFNGMSQTPEGPIEYLPNPYKEQNLAFSLQMQLDAAAYFPGFTRKIYLKGFRYNLHLRPRSALIEVGAQTNTYEEARNAMEPLAELLDMVLAPEG